MIRYKYSLENCKNLDSMNSLDLLNGNKLDESVVNAIGSMTPNYEYSSSAEGDEDGDEDMTDYEGEESEVGGVEPEALPKFRKLVKEKKLSLKSQYGKSRWVVTETWRNSPSVGSTVSLATALAHPRKTVWHKGWRRQWKLFKKNGGLAQLKQQARGLVPVTSNTPTPINTPTVAPTRTSGIPKKRLSPSSVVTKSPVSTRSESESESTDVGLSSGKLSAPSDDDKILGMPKTAFYVGLGIVVLVGGFIAYKKFIAKK